MEKLVLIDGNSLINRAFYAMPVLTTKDGVPTNAVYGFMNMLFKIATEIKPQYLAVAFDVHAPTFRHQMYSEYKGTRKPMPEELRPQIPLLKELLGLAGVYVCEKAGLEADDIIGTIAKNTKIQTVIFTGDRDSFQLVDEETEVHFTRRGITDVEIYNAKNFLEKTTITPSQIIELKALMGDASDNIPGIDGIGEKTAYNLLHEYSTVDNLYKNVDNIVGKLGEKIKSGKEQCYLSRRLATIKTDCDIDTDVGKMQLKLPFPAKLKQRFVELEFKSLFSRDNMFTEEKEVKENKSQVKTLYPKLEENIEIVGEVSLVIGESSVNIYNGKAEYVYPIRKTLLDDGYELTAIINGKKQLFFSGVNLILFDKKETAHFLFDNFKIRLNAHVQDVAIMKYLADFSGGAEKLADVIEGYGYDKNAPAYSLYQIYFELKEKLEKQEMTGLYKDVELPLSDVLFSMEESGFKVDATALYKIGEEYKAVLQELESDIKSYAEKDINVNSPKQLGDLLFNQLKLGKGKKTKSGFSTSIEVLEELEDSHPIIPLIIKYRQIQKLQSTYIEGFKPLIDKSTGLIHTTFSQTVTSTGRLSSKEPNLQNIPVREDVGKELRKFFVPKSEDRILIGADYSQIELRLLAAFSNCRPLVEAFNNGGDIHLETAAKVFKTPKDKVTKEMRSRAKAVNFGIIYGISEYGLAKNLKISNSEARNYIDSYFNEYKEVKEYMNKNVEFAKKNGYAITVLKRRRYIRELLSSAYNIRQFGERAAMNMPLQGSSADIIKLAMIRIFDRLKKENLKSELILQIHDELIIDAFIDESEKVKKILVEEMENAVKLCVPLTVDVASGKTWYDAK